MTSTFTTGFGIEKIGSGEQDGTWGTTTNHNLDILDRIASYKAVAITTNADTATLTVREASPGSGTENLQDGMYRVIKFTGALDSACTITIAPNTAPAWFIIENATTDSGASGPYSIILTQGSGANVTVQNGKNAVIYCDGAGSGAAIVNALSDLQIATLEVTGAAAIDGAATIGGAITGSSTIQGTTITATTAFVPDASDGAALGTAALEFSDLFLADEAVAAFGDDQDVTLTHVADTGLLLNSTRQLQFGDSGTYIHQSADGVLDLVSDTEIEINATTIDINGAVALDGAITGATNITLSGELDAATGDFSGAVAIDGTLTAAAITATTLTTSGIVSVDDTTTSTSGTTGSIHTDGGLGVAGTAFVAGTAKIVGVTTHGGNVVSDTDSTDDLGTTSVRWKELFVDAITATDQVTATGFTGTLDGILGSGSAAAATVTTFTSTGIDDNADDNVITIGSNNRVDFAGDGDAFGIQLKYNAATAGVYIGSPSANAFQVSSSGGGAYLNINSSGNVGIGTSAGTTTVTNGLAINNATATNYPGLEIQTAGTTRLYLNANNAASYITAVGNTTLSLSTNSEYRLHILGDGKVGIGTTAPGFKVEIVGGTNDGIHIKDAASATVYGGLFTQSAALALVTRSNHALSFGSNDTTRMTINSGGNILVSKYNGTAASPTESSDWPTPVMALRGYGNYELESMLSFGYSNDDAYQSTNAVWNFRLVGTASATASSSATNLSLNGPGFLALGSATAETMRLASGNLLVGGSSFNANGSVCIGPIGTSANGCTAVSASSSATNIWRFYNTNGQVGSISTSGTATTFAGTSDYRLKENVIYADLGAISRLKQLKPVRFNFIADADTTVDGFLAHEVQGIVPEAVVGEKDAVNEDGSIEAQGIDQAKLVPLLTAALQEAVAKIEALETRITALEG